MQLTIRNQIILLAIGLTTGVCLLLTVLLVDRLSNEREKLVQQNFLSHLDSLSNIVNNSFRNIDRDILTLAELPPISGIARSRQNEEIDPLDGSSTAIWKDRLATIFTAMLKNRELYFQIRLIDAADNGREMVRVDRLADGSIIRAEQLQEKWTEPYFYPSTQLQKGELYYAPVSLNREFNKVTESKTPTLRVSTPVFDPQGRIYAFLIININYKKLITALNEYNFEGHSNFLIDNQGNLAAFSDNQSTFQYHESNSENRYKNLIKVLQEQNRNNGVFTFTDAEGAEHVVGYNSQTIFSGRKGLSLTYAVSKPQELLLQPVKRVRNRSLIIGALLITFAGIIAYISSSRLTHSILKRIKQLGDIAEGRQQLPDYNAKDDELDALLSSISISLNEAVLAKQMEIESLEKYQMIFNSVIDGLLVFDENGKIREANKAATTIFGFINENPVGSNISELIPNNLISSSTEIFEKHLGDKQENILGKIREIEAQHRDGSKFPIDIVITGLKQHHNNLFIAVVRDITPRKQREEELKRLLKELKQSNDELDDFAYVVSHDLREPLRGMQMHAQKLIKKLEHDANEDTQRRIHRIDELAEKLFKQVGDLLFFSRLGRSEMAMEHTNINTLVSDVTISLKAFLKENNAQVEIKGSLPEIICDKAKVFSIFSNLIQNGVKYNQQQEKKIEILFYKKLLHENNIYNNVFCVKDNGIGIDSSFHRDIFKIFKRLHSDSEYGFGTGSGLTFVKKSIEKHGGNIWMTSKPDEGSSFYFTLSYHYAEDNSLPVQTIEQSNQEVRL